MNRNDSGRNHTAPPLRRIVFLFVCLLLLPGRAPALAASAAEDLLQLAGKDAAYRIDLSRRFERNIDLLRAMDELMRQGQKKYGSMPRFDTGRNEYYWITKGHRFSFSRYSAGTIRVCLSGE